MLNVDADTGREMKATPVNQTGNRDRLGHPTRLRRRQGWVDEVIDLNQAAVVHSLPPEPNVHTFALDPDSHAIYVYRNEIDRLDVFSLVDAASRALCMAWTRRGYH